MFAVSPITMLVSGSYDAVNPAAVIYQNAPALYILCGGYIA